MRRLQRARGALVPAVLLMLAGCGGGTDTAAERFETPGRQSPPPTDAERDAPLVPDLRPTRRPRTDGGSR